MKQVYLVIEDPIDRCIEKAFTSFERAEQYRLKLMRDWKSNIGKWPKKINGTSYFFIQKLEVEE